MKGGKNEEGLPKRGWGRERKMRRRPSSRSKSGGVEEGGDTDVLYETVIIKHHPTGIFIFLRTHVPLPAGNSRLPARAKGGVYSRRGCEVISENKNDNDDNSGYNCIRMVNFGWLGIWVMSGEKVVEYDGGKDRNRETCHLRENPDRPPPPPHTVP
jgi:hypothetical protein